MHRTIIGQQIYPIGLGGMPMSLEGRPAETQSRAVIQRFVELGGNFIDTANVYCCDDDDIGHNERLIGQVLKELNLTDRILVATKGGLRRPKGSWTVDGSPQWLRASCEKSLSDLGVDCISLYQLHAVDPQVSLEVSLTELVKLKEEGKIAHLGLSNVSLRQLQQALKITPIVSVQNRCHPLAKQDFDSGLVQYCAEVNVVYIPHSPVGGHIGHRRFALTPQLVSLAEKHHTSSENISLAWLLHQGQHIVPIPGASNIASIEASMRSVAIKLSSDELNIINHLPNA